MSTESSDMHALEKRLERLDHQVRTLRIGCLIACTVSLASFSAVGNADDVKDAATFRAPLRVVGEKGTEIFSVDLKDGRPVITLSSTAEKPVFKVFSSVDGGDAVVYDKVGVV